MEKGKSVINLFERCSLLMVGFLSMYFGASTFGTRDLHDYMQCAAVTFFIWSTGAVFLLFVIVAVVTLSYRIRKGRLSENFGIAMIFATIVVVPAFFVIFPGVHPGFLDCALNVLNY